MDLSQLAFLQHSNPFEYVRKLLSGQPHQDLLPLVDARSARSNQFSEQIKKIQRRDAWLQEESGARDLYVGWPFVEGTLRDGTLVRAPLLLFPVALREAQGSWLLCRRSDQVWDFNKTFHLAYCHYNQVAWHELPEPEADDFPQDALEFRTALYHFLKEHQYQLHFNRALFEEVLQPFEARSRSQWRPDAAQGILQLQPQAVLGFFPYAGTWMVQDYDWMEQQGHSSMTHFFPARAPAPALFKEEQVVHPLPMDGSQEQALRAVKAGNSLVVQGPPGTGKSQLIVNVIADFCARGKKVLVVSQKRAALEVVQQRLKELQLAPFAALLHDLRAERTALYQHIAAQIEQVPVYQQENNKLDTVLLDRQFTQACRQMDQALENLERYRQALFDEHAFGISAKELYLCTEPGEAPEAWRSLARKFTRNSAAAFETTLRLLLPRYRNLNQGHYAFRQRRNIHRMNTSEEQQVLEDLQRWDRFNENKGAYFRTSLQGSETLLASLLQHLESLSAFLENCSEDTWTRMRDTWTLKKTQEAEGRKWMEVAQRVSAYSGVRVPASTIPSLQKAMKEGLEKYSSPFGKMFWKWRVAPELKRFLQENNANASDLEALQQQLSEWQRCSAQIEKIQAERWLPNAGEHFTTEDWERWMETLQFQIQGKSMLLSLESIWKLEGWKKVRIDDLRILLEAAIRWGEEFRSLRNALRHWFQESQLLDWLGVNALGLAMQFRKDFHLLKETDLLVHACSAAEQEALALLSAEENAVPEDFMQYLKRSWLAALEHQHPALLQPSTGSLQHYTELLQHAVQQKQQCSLAVLQLRLKERSYQQVEYNRLRNMTTYRELLHQCRKKRNTWPVRRLMQEFHEELFQLIPCWMASPETVSALFPPEQYFDLVIFDEASQCYTEKGLPVLCRAKQYLIAGDSMQLRPSDLYRVRWDQEEDAMEEEAESLLELAAHYLPQHFLGYHYRSAHRSLIDFSNQHFYQSKLELIPACESAQQSYFYHTVQGLWSKNQNLPEAEKVVALVLQLYRERKGSVGVVTFNYQQASLIQELLDEKMQAQQWNRPADLFVKNIENVQGDERDCIVFSLAYAPDAKGVLHARFGSLHQEDGPNRLNVAITRARKEIHIVSSFMPAQLEVEHLASQGPALLKEYLQFAWDQASGKSLTYERTLLHPPHWYLKSKLVNATWKLSALPIADLQQGQHVLLTDDDMLYQKSSKEFFAWIPMALEQKGWKVSYAFSGPYYRHGAGACIHDDGPREA
ncbi:MAG: AAA domain-containing protein [Cytophagaceae bacterium]|nr:AAA domain-containing protein [Cytophagaceae bacterium]